VIDVEPLIVAGLDRLVPLPSGARADWQDVLGRAGETRRRRWLGVPRPSAWSRLQIAVVVIVVGLMLAAAATATYLAVRKNGGPAFGVAHLTPRQIVASDVNHTSYRDTRLWSNAADDLNWQLENFGDRRGFITALQAAIQESNSLEPESHSNRCYRWIVIYRKVLNDLQTGFRDMAGMNDFARKASLAEQALRHAGHQVWGACVREEDRP
jgi:hypothetical protein